MPLAPSHSQPSLGSAVAAGGGLRPGAATRFTPPPLPARGARHDRLSRPQRHALIATMVGAHVALGWGLLQISNVREAVVEAAPIFVSLIAPPAPPPPKVVPPPPVPQPPRPRPQRVEPRPPPPTVIAAAPSPAPAPFVVPAPPPLPEPSAPAPAPAPPPAPPAPPAPPPPPPAPKVIPASAVQYLVRPVPEYPRLSQRNGETGRVMIDVLIEAEGPPKTVRLAASSGFSRLDNAALEAVRKARFKPHFENGQTTAVWATIPLEFELEK
ncbi:energy transducer TonB [Piscinibacter koreensis]|uniref:Energy transducer TonB n=1 Tax=Piscinibacter koreensis TaxID=2742824 RepID=A0A7Y6TUX4_9BURK|nr:energy transducer TonB [Schlegelella koreensis]NUZ04460.1 energy transducer TonB [Schlegelella koreensis]